MPDYPVLVFDWKELPNIADHIWQAQMAGWERILTYRGPLPDRMSRPKPHLAKVYGVHLVRGPQDIAKRMAERRKPCQ